jgi:hypothetical protein
MKLARQRTFLVIAGVAILSGGTAWAAGGVPHPSFIEQADVDDTSTTSTTVDDSTTTTVDDSTTTTVDDSTTTTVDDSTTTTTVDDSTTTTIVAAECKPGWGHGDTNHCHSGPPGQNKHDDEADTADDEACKPGWGYGDKNHCHSGPPKQED